MNLAAIYRIILKWIFLFEPVSMASTVKDASPCPVDLVEYRQSCYLIGHNQARVYSGAKKFCHEHSSHLIRIDNADEQAFLKSYLGEINAAEHYLGINDMHKEGVWVWEDTGRQANFTAWQPSQPGSEAGNEDCAVIAPQYDYRWADLPCSASREPLCEKRPRKVRVLNKLDEGSVHTS